MSVNKRQLDLSSVQLDGSHTRAQNGGEAVGYQGRKSAKTSNSIFLCDNTGQMLSVSSPQCGEHNDLYDIDNLLTEIISVLNEADINTAGLFLNADAGFDSDSFKNSCSKFNIEANVKPNPRNGKTGNEYQYFDDKLYERRTKIEHANAWLDGFKALLIRFETKAKTGWQCNGSLLSSSFLEN